MQPQNHCYKVLSSSANARNSLYRQKPQQASHEDVSAWHRRLVALGTEAFKDIGQWNRESHSVVTNCFIRRSKHVDMLAKHMNRTLLKAAGATARSNHLNALACLFGEKSLEDQDIHPLDNYHLLPTPAVTAGNASSLTADAGSEQKSRG